MTIEECQNAVGEGWGELVERCWDLTQKHNGAVVQVKEKFGTLRFYTFGGDGGLLDEIWAIEAESAKVCERCGDSGRLRLKQDYPEDAPSGWLLTLCDRCFQNRVHEMRMKNV